MGNKRIQRIAYVKLTSQGKSYAMRCDREDLGVNDEVEVLMYAGTDRAYYDDGVITATSHERWDCSCHVVNHISEVEYSFNSNGFARKLKLRCVQGPNVQHWHEHKAPYLRLVSDTTRSDRTGLREEEGPEKDID